METQLLSTLAQIAGIGGVALGVFLLIFRDVIRKKIFPQLTKQQAYRLLTLALVLTWSVAISGIIAWLLVSNGPNPTAGAFRISATIWGISLDAKGDAVATTEIAIEEGSAIGREDLEQLATWLVSELGVADAEPPRVDLTIRVPADPGIEPPVIRRSPEGPITTLMWIVEGSKVRVPLNQETLAGWHNDFTIEVIVPGYTTVVEQVAWGEERHREVRLEPSVVNIGVEEFAGVGAGFADRLTGVLVGWPRVKVVSPDSLEVLRNEVRRHNDLIARNPNVQSSLRSLAVDYILGGSVQRIALNQ